MWLGFPWHRRNALKTGTPKPLCSKYLRERVRAFSRPGTCVWAALSST
jgi:hypothetical protein